MVLQCMWVNWFTTIELNGYLSLQGVSSATVARWILYEYNRWLVSATAEECVVSEKHLTQFFGKFGQDPTRPDPTRPAGQPDPCPAVNQTYTIALLVNDSDSNRLCCLAGQRARSESETAGSGLRLSSARLRENDQPVSDIHSKRTFSTLSC